MVVSQNLVSGMIIEVGQKLYRVDAATKVTLKNKNSFIKATLSPLQGKKKVEKNFKIGQSIQEVILEEHPLEYLYKEGSNHMFLRVDNLDTLAVPEDVIGDRINYLKESVAVMASFYGEQVFSIELPQFLEIMIVDVDEDLEDSSWGKEMKKAELETGAAIYVPPFVEIGDIIKVDTYTDEYVQRV